MAKAALRPLWVEAPLCAPVMPGPLMQLSQVRPPQLGDAGVIGRGSPAVAERLESLERLRQAAELLLHAQAAKPGLGPVSGSVSGLQGRAGSKASVLAPLLDAVVEAGSASMSGFGLQPGVSMTGLAALKPAPAAAQAPPRAPQAYARGVGDGHVEADAAPAQLAPASVRGMLFQPGRPDAVRQAIAERLNRLSLLQQRGEQLLAAR